jgi:hypothetical protein
MVLIIISNVSCNSTAVVWVLFTVLPTTLQYSILSIIVARYIILSSSAVKGAITIIYIVRYGSS